MEETNLLLSLENKAYEIACLLGKNEYEKKKIEKFFYALGQLNDFEENEEKDPSVAYFKALKGWLLRIGSEATSERLIQTLHEIEWEKEAESIQTLCQKRKKTFDQNSQPSSNLQRRILKCPHVNIFTILIGILTTIILIVIVVVLIRFVFNKNDQSNNSAISKNETDFESVLTICSFYNLDYSIPKKLFNQFPIDSSKYPSKFTNGEHSVIIKEKILFNILNSNSNTTAMNISYRGIHRAFDSLINPLLIIAPSDIEELNLFYPHLLSLTSHYEHFGKEDEELRFLLLLKMTIFNYKLNLADKLEVSGKLVELEKRIYGEYSSDYETGMGILAGFYYISGQEEKATNLYEQCYKIGEFNKVGMRNKSNIRITKKEIDLWKILLQNTNGSLTKIEMGNILNRIGSLTEQSPGLVKIAKGYYTSALEIFHELFGKTHPSYRNILLKYDRLKQWD